MEVPRYEKIVSMDDVDKNMKKSIILHEASCDNNNNNEEDESEREVP